MVKKKYILAITIVLTMGMIACSSEPKEETESAGVIDESETEKEESLKTELTEIKVTKDDEKEYSAIEEKIEGDPIIGIVEKYADNIIVIKDGSDEDLIYYFSTQNAQIVEGDSPIAVGEEVEITYQGVMGDEEHPGVAVKVVAASMIYNTEGDDK